MKDLISTFYPAAVPVSEWRPPVVQDSAVLDHFINARHFTDRLCDPLEVEDYGGRSMEDASPVKWHLAHMTLFFEQRILRPYLRDYRPFAPEFASLFEAFHGGEAAPLRCCAGHSLTLPAIGEIIDYRRHVDREMRRLLQSASRKELKSLASLVWQGIHHEQKHQELLLADLKHLFSQNPSYPVYQASEANEGAAAVAAGWREFGEGVHDIGHPESGFSYANERPRHRQFIEPFKLALRLVTNGEFIRFIEDGGYQSPSHWLALGWRTAKQEKWEAPLYWIRKGGVWHHYTLHGLRLVDPDEPLCHISYFEAEAFARWSGARLPTEAEWEIAAIHADPREGNLAENGSYHPVPARACLPGALCQQFGDVWEWTASSFLPYPGYKPSGDDEERSMCNQMVLRGGSCVTSREHIRPTYRNSLPPEKRWQFSGIRLAGDIS